MSAARARAGSGERSESCQSCRSSHRGAPRKRGAGRKEHYECWSFPLCSSLI